MNANLRIGALISGGGTNLQAVIDACENHSISGRVVFVGSDNPEAKGLARAERHGIPSFVVDYGAILQAYRRDPAGASLPDDFDGNDLRAKCRLFPQQTDPERVRRFLETRAMAEAALIGAMAAHPCDLLILAGFMRTLSPYFIDRVNGDRNPPRIMNIHPALLPSFPGTHVWQDQLDYGVKVAGCTVHFVDEGMDSGPIIIQAVVPVLDEDDADRLAARILRQEHRIYPRAIQLFAEGRLVLDGRRVKVRDLGESMDEDRLTHPPLED